MDDCQSEKNIKKDLAMDSANANAKLTDASSILDVSQTIQQLLAMSSIASGAILSPMQFLQASASPGASTSQFSLPWIVPHHYQQMMVLQQGLAQPFLMSDVVEDKDGHMVVMPTSDQVHQYNNSMSLFSSPSDLPMAQAQGVQSASDSSAGRLKNYQMNAAQKPAVRESTGAMQLVSSAGGVSPKRGGPVQHGQLHSDSAKMPRPRPPKKPLTPYMLFSKEMWHQVKAANSHLSLVTEIGAIIGSMWRELDAEKKEHYNELFSRDKIRYDEEIRLYLKDNNMHPSDLIRARLSKKKDSKSPNQHHHRPQVAAHASTILNSPGQQLVQSLLGYPVGDGSQALISLDGALPNNLLQAWAGQPIHQILAQMGLAGHLTQTSGDDVQMREIAATCQQQQQQLASHAHAIFSNACGNSEELVRPSTARSSDSSSAVGHHFNVDSAVSTTDKSKLWSWSTGQHPNSNTSMQDNYDKSTDRGGGGGGPLAGQAAEEPMAGHSLEAAKTVYCSDINNWSQAKCDGQTVKSDEVGQLESRLLFLENALSEKNKEIEKLVDQLAKAHQVIASFRIQPDVVEGEAMELSCGANVIVAGDVALNLQHQ